MASYAWEPKGRQRVDELAVKVTKSGRPSTASVLPCRHTCVLACRFCLHCFVEFLSTMPKSKIGKMRQQSGIAARQLQLARRADGKEHQTSSPATTTTTKISATTSVAATHQHPPLPLPCTPPPGVRSYTNVLLNSTQLRSLQQRDLLQMHEECRGCRQ